MNAETRENITDLFCEASNAGDYEQMAICHRALGHDQEHCGSSCVEEFSVLVMTQRQAIAECERVIREARAQTEEE